MRNYNVYRMVVRRKSRKQTYMGTSCTLEQTTRAAQHAHVGGPGVIGLSEQARHQQGDSRWGYLAAAAWLALNPCNCLHSECLARQSHHRKPLREIFTVNQHVRYSEDPNIWAGIVYDFRNTAIKMARFYNRRKQIAFLALHHQTTSN